jgi:hypothetical protein
VADLDLPSTVVGRIEQLAAESPGPDVDPARSAGADDFRSVLVIESAGRRRELRWTGAVAPPDVADIVAALLPLARPAT